MRFRLCILILLTMLATTFAGSSLYAQKSKKKQQQEEPPTEMTPEVTQKIMLKHDPRNFRKPNIRKELDTSREKPWSSKHTGHRPDSLAEPIDIVKDTTMEIIPGRTMIYLERSNLVRFDNELMPDIQILEGDVLLRHEDALLWCDSAYLNQVTNSFEAFGHVKMKQADTLTITAKHLIYHGDTKIAYLHQNVKMRNRKVTLETDTLTYERGTNIGYYTCGGVLNDERNHLVSKHGYYHSDTKLAEFKYDVVGTNEDSRIESDTLTYNTDNKVAGIVGPTIIYHQAHDDPDSVLTVIHSSRGWYDTNANQAELLDHSLIIHDKHNFITSDTIFYDNKKGYGKMFTNMETNDTTNKMILQGNYGFYQEEGEIMLATDSARIIDYSRKDSLFAHADTLYSFAVDTNKVALAYHNGRIYSNDFQAVSDSIVFNTVDSITHLMQLPIAWQDSMQITGDTIRIYPKGDEIDHIHVKGNAIIVQQEDTIHFSQISGKDIIAYVLDGDIEHLEVMGNAESIMYPKEDDGTLIGLNKMMSSYIHAFFRDGDIWKVKVFPSPQANMYPMEQINEGMLKLANFTWQIEVRPKDKQDIFSRPKRATREELEAQKRAIREQEKAEKRKKRLEDATNSDNQEQEE